ncbi:MAG: hypothetical protein P1V97_25915, partial [Planctomycetota bacterium]|nr:hypothetical protein [Planctomycetota bacterium]
IAPQLKSTASEPSRSAPTIRWDNMSKLRLHSLKLAALSHLVNLSVSILISILIVYFIENSFSTICFHTPLFIFDCFQIFSLLSIAPRKRELVKQWTQTFGDRSFDIWSVGCPDISPSYYSPIHCGINHEEIILGTEDEWSMSRDWPLNWIESFDYDSESNELSLQIRKRPPLILHPRTPYQARSLLRCYEKHRSPRPLKKLINTEN